MDIEVSIAGSNKRILVKIPPARFYSSNVMLGIPSPRLIQLGDSPTRGKENILNSGTESLPCQSPHQVYPLSSNNSETHSSEIQNKLECPNPSAVLRSANPNIPVDIEMDTSDISTTNVYEPRLHYETPDKNTDMILPDPVQQSKRFTDAQTSKLVAKRIIYIADAAVEKLFGSTELLSPEYLANARYLRQELISTLASVVKEHLQQKICGPSSTNSQVQSQLVQEEDIQRTLRPSIQTRVR